MEYFAGDRDSVLMETAVVVCKPLQEFLSEAFAAEAAVTKCSDVALTRSPMLSLEPADAARYSELQMSALQNNVGIASGAAGKRVVAKFSQFPRVGTVAG